MTAEAALPIGVFDSGVGGLTVVRELTQRLPRESILYFGDTARVPYGSKSPDTVQRYATEAAEFLLRQGIKLLVVACNTATAHAGEVLAARIGVPVIGVIEPGARAAVAATRSGRIGVLGTVGTIASGAYDLAIRRQLPGARIYAQPCPLFVPLVEEGMVNHPAARLIAQEYLEPLLELDVDVVVLGCTHYPLLSPLLGSMVPAGTVLVDSGLETARVVERALAWEGLLASGSPEYRFVVTDAPLRFREVGRNFVGDLIATVEQVRAGERQPA